MRTFVTVSEADCQRVCKWQARGVWSLIGAMRSMTTTAARATGFRNTFIGRLFGIASAADQAAAAFANSIEHLPPHVTFGGMLAGLRDLSAAVCWLSGVAAIAMGAKSAAGAGNVGGQLWHHIARHGTGQGTAGDRTGLVRVRCSIRRTSKIPREPY